MKLKKLLETLGNILLVVVIVFGVIVGVSLLPIKNNYKLLAVKSGSMEPILHVGTLIFVRPSENYSTGEIITFKPLGSATLKETTTHRIESIERDQNGFETYITRGDANNVVDQVPVYRQQIVGKLMFGIPLLGYIINVSKTLPGLLLIIIIPATIIIYEEIKKIHHETKHIIKKRRKKKQSQKGGEKEKINA